MLTRSQVARRLGRSIATVRRMEGIELHPRRDADGVHHFDEREVATAARRGRSRAQWRAGFEVSSATDNDESSAPPVVSPIEELLREQREVIALQRQQLEALASERRRGVERQAEKEEEQLDLVRAELLEELEDMTPRELRRLSQADWANLAQAFELNVT